MIGTVALQLTLANAESSARPSRIPSGQPVYGGGGGTPVPTTTVDVAGKMTIYDAATTSTKRLVGEDVARLQVLIDWAALVAAGDVVAGVVTINVFVGLSALQASSLAFGWTDSASAGLARVPYVNVRTTAAGQLVVHGSEALELMALLDWAGLTRLYAAAGLTVEA